MRLLSYDGDAQLVEQTDLTLLKNEIQSLLGHLPPRLARVLELRFGLKDGITRTLWETGIVFGVTPERIRQIEARALRLLRHPTLSRRLKGYLGDSDETDVYPPQFLSRNEHRHAIEVSRDAPCLMNCLNAQVQGAQVSCQYAVSNDLLWLEDALLGRGFSTCPCGKFENVYSEED
jgi:hypothetical protein